MHSYLWFFLGQIPSVGGDETSPEDREKTAEQEKLRQEAIKQAEQERRVKHKKLEEQRENMRQGIRDRVSCFIGIPHFTRFHFTHVTLHYFKKYNLFTKGILPT